ncbi:MAG TPA: hypothetical protein VF413_09690 [Cellulomonas sp.]
MTRTDPHDTSGPAAAPASTSSGPGRALVGVYGVFALSASARAGYQIATKLAEAPLAYGLSAFSAVVYILATVALAKGGGRWRPVAWSAVLVELVGVLVVGSVSLLDASDFPAKTVWSAYGQGYGYVPLVLPFLGLAWLWHTRSRSAGDGSEAVADQ